MQINYLIKFLLAALFLSISVMLFESIKSQQSVQYLFASIPWFIFFISLFTYSIFKRALIKNRKRFIPLFLLITFAKLFIYSTLIILYLFLKGPMPLHFAIIFLLSYFVFSVIQQIEFYKLNKSLTNSL
jgi:hypothetical protein